MKKWLITLAVTGFSLTGLAAQDLAPEAVPGPVQASLQSKYPEAAEAKWKKNKSGKYEADFKLSGRKAEAKFDANGTWLSSEVRVDQEQMPAAIASYVKQHYNGYEVDKVKLKEESSPASKKYEVDLKKGDTETELSFDSDGKFLKKKEKEKKA